jgi:hypothetical protein
LVYHSRVEERKVKKKLSWKDIKKKKYFKDKKDIKKLKKTKFVCDWDFLKKAIYKEIIYER